jgi:hypothetical protein
VSTVAAKAYLRAALVRAAQLLRGDEKAGTAAPPTGAKDGRLVAQSRRVIGVHAALAALYIGTVQFPALLRAGKDRLGAE